MTKRLKTIPKKKRQWHIIAIIVFLVLIAIIGYSIKRDGAPLRVAFATSGGGVIFDHQKHVNLKDTKCSDCHHNYNDNVAVKQPVACRECHYKKDKDMMEICKDAPLHKRCIGTQCASCHATGSVNCTFCHNAEQFTKPAPPAEVTFETDGGTVIFNHQFHATEEGAALDCAECHHGYDAKKPTAPMSMSCRQCHYNTKYKKICESQDPHIRCIGKNCLDCHSDGVDKCEMCHKQ